ncbi:MAG: transaldolase family protein [Eubacteriales bacterium]|nr:transaldolase family protein [Eubacteriales bacterium]
MKGEYFKEAARHTATRFWINNVTDEEALLALDAGAVGCTQNPSYSWKILNNSSDREHALATLKDIMKTEKDDNEALVKLQRDLIGRIAKRFMPLYESSHGKLGYVSIQGDPFQEDTDSIIRYAHFNREASPNMMAKIPATEEGLKAITILAAEGVPINATECMAIRQVIDTCEAYLEGTRNMKNPPVICFSLITGIFDQYLQNTVKENNIDIDRSVLWQAGMAVAKKVHEIVADRQYPINFIGGGARGLHHFTEMVGANASITINWKGAADQLIEQNLPVVSRFLQPTLHGVVDELVEKLEDFRKAYFINAIAPHEYEEYGPVVLFRSMFEDSWKQALKLIASLR